MKFRAKYVKRYREMLRNGQVLICGICKEPISRGGDKGKGQVSVDHIHPVSKGGKNDKYNIQPAHQKCNWSRGNKPLEGLNQ